MLFRSLPVSLSMPLSMPVSIFHYKASTCQTDGSLTSPATVENVVVRLKDTTVLVFPPTEDNTQSNKSAGDLIIVHS